MRLAGKGCARERNGGPRDPWKRFMLAHPRLTGMVLDIPHLDPSFLPQLTLYGVFEHLPGFHEAREGRIVL